MNEEDLKYHLTIPDAIRAEILRQGPSVNLVKTNRPEQVINKEIERLEERIKEQMFELAKIQAGKTHADATEKIQRLKSKYSGQG